MTENQNILQLSRRAVGKKAVKAVRKEGFVPGVFYNKTGETFPFSVKPLEVRGYVYTKESHLINIQFKGETEVRECILKDVTFDPVSDEIRHLDFYGIVEGQKMHVEVPVVLKGTSKGVRLGGILQQSLRKVKIEVLPKNLPPTIEVDITNMEIGSTIYLKDLKRNDLDYLIPSDTAVVSVIQSRVSKDAEPTK